MAELDKVLTLGDVLYARGESHLSTESEWVELVRSTAAGNEAALQSLYVRASRPVFTLMVRITANRQTAEELTLDVFHDVWRRAAQYNPDDGTVLGWIMNQARSRAIDRLRFDFRKKRHNPDAVLPEDPAVPDPQDLAVYEQQTQILRDAVAKLAPEQRSAIEHAFFLGLTYPEVAMQQDEPLGTIKTRMRAALHKLRQSLAEGVDEV